MELKTVLNKIKEYSLINPNKLAVIDTSTELSYKQYYAKITSIAYFLKNELNIAKGEYVIIKNSQDVKYLSVIHGIQLMGAVPVPLEKSVNEGRVIEIVEQTKSKLFLGDIKIDKIECYTIDYIFNCKDAYYDFSLPKLDDEAMVLFTTGTTGRSKGIVLEYIAEYATAENITVGVEMKKDNIELIPMPMNHSFSLRRYFANMINGSTVIVIDGVFFVKILFNMIEKYDVTSLALVPAAISIIFKLTRDKISDYKNQLDYIQFGSAPIPEIDKKHLIDILPNTRMYNIYGSTEMGCACILNFASKDNMPSCIGYPAKNSIFKIIDENGNEKNSTLTEPGFISYSGTMKMKGYLNNKELTEKTIINDFLVSTDLGYKDEYGRIFMLGRNDDVILSGGNKISPLEVEELARKFKGVNDCICKGRKEKIVEFVPVLYIVADDELDDVALLNYLKNNLEDFKLPKDIIKINSVPRTYNGKVDRKAEINT